MKCLIALGAMALLAESAFATIITDPVGDASGHADVVALSGVYNHTSLFLSAQFHPGTLDPNNLAFFIGLDTDENLATGEQQFFPIGSEFVVDFNSLARTSQATIFQQARRTCRLGSDFLRHEFLQCDSATLNAW